MDQQSKWFVRGDIDGFFGLFVDNLLQLMVIFFLCGAICGFPVELTVGRILPAAALSILVGNLYYGWQAKKLMEATGRDDVTALPYGINTPSVFAYIFLVMGPVYAQTQDYNLAWKVGLVACLVSGVIESAGAFCGGWIRRVTPRAALLSALAGIAITFISMDFVFRLFAHPLISIVPMIIILAAYAGRIRLPLGLPGGFLALLVGTGMAWGLRAAGYETFTPVAVDIKLGFHLPLPVIGDIVSILGSAEAWKYLAVVIPMGLFNVIGSLQNLESAEAAGDTFPTMPSMLANGIGTIVAALLGSCFPTTIYIGHPGWKAMGARAGYSIINGVVIVLLCVSGGILLILRFVPIEATLGILLWIGIIMTAQAFDKVPGRHALAVAFGLVPALGGWLLLNIQKTFAVGQLGWENVAARFGDQLYIEGVIALSQGFLLTSMIFAAMLVHIIDRNFRAAAAWCLAAAVFSAIGLIHAFEMTAFGVANKFGFMAAPQFVIAYTIAAVFLFGCHFLPPKVAER